MKKQMFQAPKLIIRIVFTLSSELPGSQSLKGNVLSGEVKHEASTPHSPFHLTPAVSLLQGVLPEGAEEACPGLLCIHAVL